MLRASRRPPRSRSAPANTTTVPRTPTANHTPNSLAAGTRLCERARRRRLSVQRGGREGRAGLGRQRRRDRDAVGGGSSVCGGVEPKRNGHKGAVSIDLRQMGKVKEVDKTSRAALIEGGTYSEARREIFSSRISRFLFCCPINPRAV